MKRLLFLIAFFVLFSGLKLYSQNWEWTQSLAGEGGNIEPYRTVLDAEGNTYVYGTFVGKIKTQAGVFKDSKGDKDVFLAKFSQDGDMIWMRLGQGDTRDASSSMAIGLDGAVYISGNTKGDIEFQDVANPITVDHTHPGADQFDGFMAKYDANGNLQWAKNIVGGVSRNMVQSIYYDSVGDKLLVASFFQSEAILSPTVTLHSQVANRFGTFVAELNTDGDLIDQHEFTSPAPGMGRIMFTAIRRFQNYYYLTGSLFSTVEVGATTVTSQGFNDIILCKMDLAFNEQWIRSIKSSARDLNYSLVVRNTGVLIGAYSNSPTITLETSGAPETLDLSTSSYDPFLVKYSLDGELLTKEALLSTSEAKIFRSYYGENDLGKIAYTGVFKGQMIVGVDTLTSASGKSDVFWMVTDTNNTILYASQTHGLANDRGLTTIISGSGEAIVAGSFKSDPITFPSDYGEEKSLNVSDVGYSNGFLAKYNLCDDYDIRFFMDSVSCQGGSNGRLKAFVFKDTTENADTIKYNWNYAWSNGETTDSIENLTAQKYYLTLTNRYGCEYIDSAEVFHKTPLAVSLLDTVTLNCASDSLSSVIVEASLGGKPYAYAWSAGVGSSNDSAAYGLPVGMHTVTVTDFCGTSVVDTINIGHRPTLEATINTHSTLIACENQPDGEAWVETTNGYGTINYAWENSSSTAYLANDLGVGLHHVTISDACTTLIDSVNVSSLPAMKINISNYTDASCAGLSDGRADVFVAGGVEPYTYTWSNGETTANASALPAGWNYVTVTDICGSKTDSVLIGVQTAMTIHASAMHETCSSGNGSVYVVFEDGVAPYTFSWANALNPTVEISTNDTVTNLSAGTYIVTVEDDCGSKKDTVELTNTPALQASLASHSQILNCDTSTNGSASLIVTNGVAPYGYAWSNGTSTTSTATDLPVGKTYVSVTDGCGDLVVDSIQVGFSPKLIVQADEMSDASCLAFTDGSASVTAIGGVPPYTYAWSNGASTSNLATDLPVGKTYVTVSDFCGSAVDSVNIVSKPELQINTWADNEACGNANGVVYVSTTNGVAPYTYTWVNTLAPAVTISTNDTVSGLSAGTYQVSVTDACGSKVASVDLTNTPPLQASLTSHSQILNCETSTNGTVSVVVSNGVAPYGYAWSNGTSTTSTATDLPVGKTYVSVTDACGSLVVDSIEIGHYPELTVQVSEDSEANCSASTDGAASVTAIGGVPPYTYAWSNGASTSNLATDLPVGKTYVTVSDICGTAIDSVNIVSKPELQINTWADNEACGNANGVAYVSTTNGVAPYTYTWVNTQAPTVTISTNDTVNNLSAGTYRVTVADACGSKVDSVQITTNLPLQAALNQHSLLLNCETSTNGSASVTALNGVPPYTYQWSTSPSTSAFATNLGVGVEYVTVTDACGSTVVDSIQIGFYPELTIGAAKLLDASCPNMNDGAASVLAIGGVQPYTYTWSNGTSTTDIATDLPEGTTYVTVSDICGEIVDFVEISVEPEMEINVWADNETCGNANGTAYVSTTDGVGPYTYVWVNTQDPAVTISTNDTVSNLSAGTYQVTVSDICGDKTATVVLTNTAPLQASLNYHSQMLNCETSTNGNASVIVSDGVAPYTYVWSNGTSTTNTATDLPVGKTYVSVTDACGALVVDSIEIGYYPELTVQVSEDSEANCSASTDGAASVTAIGGVPPYTYTWSNGTSTTDMATDLPVGITYVTVSDICGTVVDSVDISSKPELQINVWADNATCGNANGVAYVSTTNGVGPYTYEWVNTQDPTVTISTNDTVSGLSAGTYQVTVSDICGDKTATVMLTNTLPLQASLSTHSQMLNCATSTNGTVSVVVSNGVAPYTYTWSNGTSTTNTATDLPVGKTYVSVTDACGALVIDSIEIGYYPELTVQVSEGSEASCSGSTDGSASVTAIGGVPPYTYTWSNGTSTTDMATDLPVGITYVTVSDICGTVVDSVDISSKPELQINVWADNATCGNANGVAYVSTTNGVGSYTYEWVNTQDPTVTISTNDTVSGLSAGTYQVTVSDVCGDKTATVMLTNTLPLQASLSTHSQMLNCATSTNGTVSVVVSDGVAPYTYTWSNGTSTTNTATDLPVGKTYVSVTDACGALVVDSIEIGYYPELTVQVSEDSEANCSASTDGAASVTAIGGVPPYTYTWSNGTSTTDMATDLPVGITYVTVSDICGTVVGSVNISSKPELQINVWADNETCGSANGVSYVSTTNGVAPYTYTWVNTQDPTVTISTNDTVSGLSAGTYQVTVSDICGDKTATVMLTNTLPLQASLTSHSQILNCDTSTNGSVSVMVSDGVAPYTYTWSNGSSTTNTTTDLPVGVTYVTVSDVCGSEIVDSIEVGFYPRLVAYAEKISDLNCSTINDGKASVIATGGVQPYTYAWSNGTSTSNIASDLPEGMTYVSVTDMCGTVFDSVVINTLPAFTYTFDKPEQICSGSATGYVQANVMGGVPPYHYAWGTPSVSMEDTNYVDGLTSGWHTVTITDQCNIPQTDSVVIEASAPLVAQMGESVTTVMCENSTNGKSEIVASGGVPPYSYLWSNGLTTYNANDLGVGTYHVSVTDMCQDMVVDSTYIVSFSPMSIETDVTQPRCHDDENGSIEIIINQGVEPYQILWSHTSDEGLVQENLSSGSYQFTVTDECGSISNTVELFNPTPLEIVADVTNESQVGFKDGSILLAVSGGTGPYLFSWSNGFFDKDLYNLSYGTYTVNVEDYNNCSISARYEVLATAIPITAMDAFTPNGDGVNEKWIIEDIAKYPNCVVKVFNQWGNVVFESKGYETPWDGTYEGKKLDAAVYYYIIDLNNDTAPRTGSVTIMY